MFQIEEMVWDESGEHGGGEVKEGKKEVTTHVSVHSIHLDGLRELYRHFLKLPDGAVVEVRLVSPCAGIVSMLFPLYRYSFYVVSPLQV